MNDDTHKIITVGGAELPLGKAYEADILVEFNDEVILHATYPMPCIPELVNAFLRLFELSIAAYQQRSVLVTINKVGYYCKEVLPI